MADYFKNTGKKLGKKAFDKAAQGSGKKISDTSQNHSISDTAKDAAKATKGAVNTGKFAAKLASQNYAGAVKEFLKDPKGILTTAVALILIPAIIVVSITEILFQQLFAVFADGVKNDVDRYLDKVSYIETNCFNNAYDAVADSLLEDICKRVKSQDLGRYKASAEIIFKDKDSLKHELGVGYDQMRNFTARNNTYSRIDAISNGLSSVFPIMEDESTGFTTSLETSEESGMTTWTKTTKIIDFGQKATYSISAIQNTNKALYEFNYLDGRFNQKGITVDMFEMIHGLCYDYDETVKASDMNNSTVKNLNDLVESALNVVNNEEMNDTNKTEVGARLYAIKMAYKSLGGRAYYLPGELTSNIDTIVKKYNASLDSGESREEGLNTKNSEGKTYYEAAKLKAVDEKEAAFKSFMCKPSVYNRILEYSLSVKDVTEFASDKSFKNGIYNYAGKEHAVTPDKTKALYIKNFDKCIQIDISINFCSYDTLGEIFGFWEIKDGDRVNLNEGLLEYLLNNGKEYEAEELLSIAEGKPIKKENSDSENTDENSETDENQEDKSTEVKPVASQSEIGWPINQNTAGFKITSRFGNTSSTYYSVSSPHGGLDMAVPQGTPIYSAMNGIVSGVRKGHASYGNFVTVDSELYINGDVVPIRLLYAHMSVIDTNTTVGTYVEKGQVIGLVGSTGNSSGPHLHFEVRDSRVAQLNSTDSRVNPEPFLEDATLSQAFYKAISSDYTRFAYTIESFFENCKDSGKAAAEILTDAGYLKSQMFWQYKIYCYNKIFCCSVIDDCRLDFFIPVDKIARNEDGSLKIVECTPESFKVSDGAGDKLLRGDIIGALIQGGYHLTDGNTAGTEAGYANKIYNKKYYAIYCQPGTEVDLPFSTQLADPSFNIVTKQTWHDLEDGNAKMVGGQNTAGSWNYFISEAKGPGGYTINTGDSNNKEAPFHYATYCFVTGALGFEVANVQISAPTTAGNESVLVPNDFEAGHYGGLLAGDYQVKRNLFDYHEANHNNSDYQINEKVLLGCALQEQLQEQSYGNGHTYNINDPNTYSYFFISVNNKNSPAILAENDDDRNFTSSFDIYDIFNLDTAESLAYTDVKTGFAWPLVKCFNYETKVTSKIGGTVKMFDSSEHSVILQNTTGDFVKIYGIDLDENLSSGSNFQSGTVLGTCVKGVSFRATKVKVSGSSYVEDSKRDSTVSINSLFEVELDIAADGPIILEDSLGRYTYVMAMMDGVVDSVEGNSVTIYSDEAGLYYEYSGPGLKYDLSENSYVAPGTLMGRYYVYDNETNDVQSLAVKVYTIDNNGNKIYHNPLDYFSEIDDRIKAAKTITIKTTGTDGLSFAVTGFILNKGRTKQLSASVFPSSFNGAELEWRVENSSVAKVSGNGLVTALSPGVTKVSCHFADGEGAPGYCDVIVPDKYTNAMLSYSIDGGNTFNVYTSDKGIIDFAVDGTKSETRDIMLKLEYADTRFAGVEWDIYNKTDSVEKNCSKESVNEDNSTNGRFKYTTIDNLAGSGTKAVIQRKLKSVGHNQNNPDISIFTFDKTCVMALNESYRIVAKSLDGGDSVEFKFRIIQPVTGITLNSDKLKAKVDLLKGKNQKVDFNATQYNVQPSNATYKDDIFLKVTDKNTDKILKLASGAPVSDNSKHKIPVSTTTTGAAGKIRIQFGSVHTKNAQEILSAAFDIEVSYYLDDIKITGSQGSIWVHETTSLGWSTSTQLTAAQKKSIPVKWQSSNYSILEVTSSGVIKGLKPGKATITVEGGGRTNSVTVDVVSILPRPEEVIISLSNDNGGSNGSLIVRDTENGGQYSTSEMNYIKKQTGVTNFENFACHQNNDGNYEVTVVVEEREIGLSTGQDGLGATMSLIHFNRDSQIGGYSLGTVRKFSVESVAGHSPTGADALKGTIDLYNYPVTYKDGKKVLDRNSLTNQCYTIAFASKNYGSDGTFRYSSGVYSRYVKAFNPIVLKIRAEYNGRVDEKLIIINIVSAYDIINS